MGNTHIDKRDKMIQELVDRWMEKRPEIESRLNSGWAPQSYGEIVETVIESVQDGNDYYGPDPKRIHEICDGDYQGTLLYVIAEKGYQPHNYYYVRVMYGSCSGCDTLEGIKYDGNTAEQNTSDYLTLMLHVVQGLKLMDDSDK